jgi:hypothetical protein
MMMQTAAHQRQVLLLLILAGIIGVLNLSRSIIPPQAQYSNYDDLLTSGIACNHSSSTPPGSNDDSKGSAAITRVNGPDQSSSIVRTTLPVILPQHLAGTPEDQDASSGLETKIQQLQASLTKSQERVGNLKAQLSLVDATQVLKIAIPTGIVEDDGLQYKSCRRVDGEWQCRDCGSATKNKEWKQCPLLTPQSPCQSWKAHEWDLPRPRRQTLHDPYSKDGGLRYAVDRLGYRGSLEQYPCVQLQDCFDMTKCKNSGGLLQVYLYGEVGEHIARRMEEGRLQSVVNLTTSPDDACLLVVTPRSYLHKRKEDFTNLTSSSFWHEGRNHFMFRSHWILDSDWDRSLPKEHSYQRAALSTPNFYQGTLRAGYDMPLYYDHPQKPFTVNDTIYDLVTRNIHRPRSLLLTFQGTIKPTSPWFQHRWLASAYWLEELKNGSNDILLNIRCPIDNLELEEARMDYVTALTSSTFVFCPGGKSPGSWRFGEALAMGAIPVVTTDFLAPFSLGNWDRCLVRINEGRIVDLPRLMRLLPPETIRTRQAACHALFVGTIGWMRYKSKWTIDFEGTTFVTAMNVWKGRVAAELQRLGDEGKLVQELHGAAESNASSQSLV